MFYFLALLILTTSWWLPWWSCGLFSFFAGLGCKSHKGALGVGFLGVFVPWFMVIYYLDLKAYGRIAEQLAALFSLPSSSAMMLMTSALGGIVGAVCSEAGYLWRNK